jgi:hypothetical protein
MDGDLNNFIENYLRYASRNDSGMKWKLKKNGSNSKTWLIIKAVGEINPCKPSYEDLRPP